MGDQSSVVINADGVATIDNSSCTDSLDKVVNVVDGVIDLSLGNHFILATSEDVELSITNAEESQYDNFYLIIKLGDFATVAWPDNVIWSEARVPILTVEGTDVIHFTTSDRTTWAARAIILDASTYRKSRLGDTEGRKHAIDHIVDDGTYTFNFSSTASKTNDYIVEDDLSFDSLSEITTEYFLHSAFAPDTRMFEHLEFNSISFPLLEELSASEALTNTFTNVTSNAPRDPGEETWTITSVNFPELVSVDSGAMRQTFLGAV